MSIQTDTCDQSASSGSLLDAVLSLAQTQIVGQLADETSIDGRTMGTLGFSGALLAADLAARGVLGGLWWVPMVVLGTATLCCVSPALRLGMDFRRGTDFGPRAHAFYRDYGEQPPSTSRAQLLSDLDRAFSSNARRLRAKERALWVAVVTLAIGLPVSLCIGILSG